MGIAVEFAGDFRGERVEEARLVSTSGVEIALLNWGVTVRRWQVPVDGGLRDVVLGFTSFAPYPEHSPHFGSLAGRVANRIAGAQFNFDGTLYRLPANEGPNCLHGGPEGLGRRVWTMEPDSAANAVRFTYRSPDGEMGFPGTIDLEAVYRLDGNRLTLELSGVPDRPTPLSLVQHHYFNLGNDETVLDHEVSVAGHAYSVVDEALVPTGAILPVGGTQYDLRTPRILRTKDGAPVDYDTNLILATARNATEPIATVRSPERDLSLRLWSDQPAVQVYNGVMTGCPVPGHGGRHYGKYSGLCLEDQMFPGALGQPHFPSIIVTPDAPYRHWCSFEIG